MQLNNFLPSLSLSKQKYNSWNYGFLECFQIIQIACNLSLNPSFPRKISPYSSKINNCHALKMHPETFLQIIADIVLGKAENHRHQIYHIIAMLMAFGFEHILHKLSKKRILQVYAKVNTTFNAIKVPKPTPTSDRCLKLQC